MVRAYLHAYMLPSAEREVDVRNGAYAFCELMSNCVICIYSDSVCLGAFVLTRFTWVALCFLSDLYQCLSLCGVPHC